MKWVDGTGKRDPVDGRPYYVTSGRFTLARWRVNDVWGYTLWNGKERIGDFDVQKDATTKANEIERAAK